MKKIGIIGAGNVGATLAFSLAIKKICKEIVLKDLRVDIAQAMALDISQASNAANSQTKVSVALENEDFANCDIIVITAGIARKPGMSRDDLLLTNAKIVHSVMNETLPYNKNAIFIIVSNPLDAMVYTALRASNLPKNRVLGMAGVLDSSRMAHFIQEKLGYAQGEIEAWVMGGHGDDMVPLINHTLVAGKKLSDLLEPQDIDEIVQKTRNGGAQIVGLLKTGSAYYAPANSASLMIEAILKDTKQAMPCSLLLQGEYGYNDVVAGVPVKLGINGAEEIVQFDLDPTQKEQFAKSINSVKELMNTLDEKFFNS